MHLRNMFNRTADHFLDMAAQILAAQIRSGIMGLFNGMFSNTFTIPNPTPTLTSGTGIQGRSRSFF